MAQITGDQLFDKASFKQATDDIVTLIGNITLAIDESRGAAMLLSQQMGGKLKAEIAGLSSQSSTLSADYKKLTEEFNNFKTSVSSTNDVLKKYKAENDDLKKKVKDLEGETKKYTQAQEKSNKTQKEGGITANGLAKSLFGVAAGTAVLHRGVTILKEQLTLAVQSTIEFEKAMKEVQAISRGTDAQLASLTANANKLGASTEKTAVEIAKLQKELAKLGFTTPEILASTQAIVDLSTATGEDLASSATVVASTLRAFGLEAVETKRVVDVMAGSFVRSGLDLEKFRESIKLVAPIAAATNISIEMTTAALSKLADAGLSGSLAGTALRNLLSNMADPTSKLATRLGFTVESSEDLTKAFRKLRDEGVGLAEAVQLVDVRARPAFFTLLNQIDNVDNLAREYASLTGEGQRLAEMMRDTLDNDIEIATSAFDAMRRGLVEGLTPAMRESTQMLTTFIEAIRLTNEGYLFHNNMLINVIEKYGWFIKNFSAPALFIQYWGKALDLAGISWEDFDDKVENATGVKRMEEMMDAASTSVTTFARSVEIVKLSPLIDEYEALDKMSIKLSYEKERMLEIERILISEFGETAVAVDTATGAFFLNTEAIGRSIRALTDEAKVTADGTKLRILEIEARVEYLKKQQEIAASETNWTKALGIGIPVHMETNKLLEEKAILVQTLETHYGRMVDTSKNGWSVFIEGAKSSRNALAEMEAEEKAAAEAEEERTKAQAENDKLRKKAESEATKAQAENDKLRKKAESEATKALRESITLENTKRDLQLAVLDLEEEKLNIELKRETDVLKRIQLENQLSDIRIQKSAIVRDKELESLRVLDETSDLFRTKNSIAWIQYYQDIESTVAGFEDNSMNALTKSLADKMKQVQKAGKDILKASIIAQKEATNTAESEVGKLAGFIAKNMQQINMVARGVSNATSMIFDNLQQKRDNELKDIDKWEQERIAMAGDNAEAIGAIEEEAEEKRKQIKIKQAKSDRREAIFQIALDTAVGIMKAVAASPLTFGMPFSAIVAAVGVAQAAIVASKPLPQFYKGTENSPEGNAWVGERGRELVKDGRTGKVTLTPNHATIMNLSKGSQVLTNEVTERVLDHNTIAYQGLRQANVPTPQSIDYDKMKGSFKEAVQDIPINITNFDEQGVRNFVVKGRSRTERLNKRYKY